MQKSVLVIDDDMTIGLIIQTLLEDEGYNVQTLPNANELEKAIEKKLPDLFIIDYLMPGKNGAEVTAHLRKRPDTKDTPIIMVAANQHYKSAARKAGVNVFLNKPFDIYELLHVVEQLIH